MVLHETKMQFVGYQELADHNTINATESGNILCEYEKLLEEDEEMEADYKVLLLNNLPKEKRAESNIKRRGKDEEDDYNCYHEEVNDPGYELFLNNLKEHDKSYILEGEENGFHVEIKYEEDSSLDKECNVEPRRKLRSAMKQINKPSNQMLGVENQRKHEMEKKLCDKNTFKSKKKKKVKLSSYDHVNDPHYRTFLQCSNFFDHSFVCEYGGHEIVYEQEDGKNNSEKDNDGSFPEVEVIDRDTFYVEVNLNFSVEARKDEENNNEKEYNDRSFFDMDNRESTSDKEEISTMYKGIDLRDITKFRQMIIPVLGKPYDEEEYDRLWQDIEFRKLEERHLDLRNGRERSCSIKKKGKSYLDHYPVLRRKLIRVEHDKPKCINLLRGFFFWLQQTEPPFRPWEDAKCLAITPESA